MNNDELIDTLEKHADGCATAWTSRTLMREAAKALKAAQPKRTLCDMLDEVDAQPEPAPALREFTPDEIVTARRLLERWRMDESYSITGLLSDLRHVFATSPALAAPRPASVADHDCGYARGSPICRECDLNQIEATQAKHAQAEQPAAGMTRECFPTIYELNEEQRGLAADTFKRATSGLAIDWGAASDRAWVEGFFASALNALGRAVSMTREDAIEVARKWAHRRNGSYDYLPDTKEAQATFQPHNWVLAAICEAYALGRAAT